MKRIPLKARLQAIAKGEIAESGAAVLPRPSEDMKLCTLLLRRFVDQSRQTVPESRMTPPPIGLPVIF